jgi:hypothetical protein
MNRTRTVAGLAMAAALCLVTGSALCAQATQAPAQGQEAGKQQYTMAEYNSYQACAAEKNPQAQVKCLDDFVAKYPNSALLVYVYPLDFNAYNQLKSYPKVIEYADKLLALGDKVEPPVRYQAYYARAFAYSALTNDPLTKDPAQAQKAREAALAGLKTLNELKKPDSMSQEDFDKQKQQPTILFNYTAGTAAMNMKDYQAAVDSFKAVLAANPDDAVTAYKIGQAYMAMNPPQQMDAFWYFAKAVAKNQNQQQANQVKTYLRKLIANYQGGNVCDSLVDAELNELLQLASTSADRPDSYKLPAAADLDAARKDMTIASVITDLKAGGDKAKITWLASCGLEFPDVPGKLIDVTPGGDSVQLKVAFVTSDAEFDSKNTPDMDVKIVGQPDAARLEKNNPVRFTATLLAYDPDPFMLHWDKGKVNAEDIPKEKEKKSPTKKRPTKRPSGGN